MDFYVDLASSPKQITGGEDTQAVTGTQTGVPAEETQSQGTGLFGMNMSWGMILVVYAVVLGGYFFFISRNNKKKEQKIQDMRKALKPGDNVCTTGGFYGKIVDVGEDVFVIEFGTNKGIRIPVVKHDVVAAKEPVLSAPQA